MKTKQCHKHATLNITIPKEKTACSNQVDSMLQPTITSHNGNKTKKLSFNFCQNIYSGVRKKPKFLYFSGCYGKTYPINMTACV